MLTSMRLLPSSLYIWSVFPPSTLAECAVSSPTRGFAAKLSGCKSLPTRYGTLGSAFVGLSETGTFNPRLPSFVGLAADFCLEALTFLVRLPDR